MRAGCEDQTKFRWKAQLADRNKRATGAGESRVQLIGVDTHITVSSRVGIGEFVLGVA